MKNTMKSYLEDIHTLCSTLDTDALEEVCSLLLQGYRDGKQIFVAGNGGSAGTSNHFSCDFGKMQ